MSTTDSGQAAWAKLRAVAERQGSKPMAALFSEDPDRATHFSLEASGLFIDYSKNRIARDGLAALLELAEERGVSESIAAMFRGDRINRSEDRPVLHTALRDRSGRSVLVDGDDACALARQECDRMLAFVDAVHGGERRGATNEELTTVVNIGIGGSDLGPQMAVEALRPYGREGRRSFFVSNVDGQHLADVLEQIDPRKTLFIVASKTFTTLETMTNAHSAVDWFRSSGMDRAAIGKHFVALSTNRQAVSDFGIPEENCFGFWDWVGGRYSLWSTIGLSIALQVGSASFLELLAGAYAMDRHFAEASLRENAPVLLALVGIWHRNVEGMDVHAVLPYDQHLHRLPAYLQQADMESNGKTVDSSGREVTERTGPVIFGEPGTNGQHAFYQLLHQGSDRMSADFIAAVRSQSELGDHHPKLLANVLAQPRALMNGKPLEQVRAELAEVGMTPERIDTLAPQKVFEGERPSNVILMERLTPHALGALIALYEHKIFVQGVIWGINSFDQWGVELGKELAKELLPLIGAPPDSLGEADVDPSTRQLLAWINARR